ncbi:MAG: hypothetical protein ACOZIN_10635 [Myxococcota bacterium]
MAAIGILSDSHGDLKAFDAAYELLRRKGAKRFFFAGGRYSDLDEWISLKKEQSRGGKEYTDVDFLADVSNFLSSQEAVPRPPAFGLAAEKAREEEDWNRVKDRFLRTPEKDSLHYRDPSISNKAVDMLGDTLVCVVYDKNDLDREDLLNAAVFVHGNQPEPKVVQIGPRFFVTPGRLTGAPEQTVALIETVDKGLSFSAFTLEGRAIIDQQALVVSGKTKLSVK